MKANSFMQIAYLVSQEAKCVSWKVGAVIAKNGRIISTGYNGTREGGINCCDHAHEQGWTELKFNPILLDSKNNIKLFVCFRRCLSKNRKPVP